MHRGRWLIACLLLLCSALFAACGGSAGTTAPIVVDMTGTWNLTSVNDRSLPFVIQPSDPKLELLSKQFMIAGSGFTSSFTVRATDLDGTVTNTTRTDAGTATLAEDVVTLRSNDGTTVTGAIAGSRMTILSGEFTQVFTRQ
jgi:hypothetical protein